MSALHRLLDEIRRSPGGMSVAQLARRLGVAYDDVDAMIGYWLHRGELVIDEIAGCGAGSCASCALASGGCAVRARAPGPVLVTIRAVGAP